MKKYTYFYEVYIHLVTMIYCSSPKHTFRENDFGIFQKMNVYLYKFIRNELITLTLVTV